VTTIADITPSSAPVALATLLRFGVAALLIELTPGPNMGYLAIVAAQRGRVAGLFVVAGVAVGLSCYLAATIAGVAQGALDNAIVYQALRWSGIGYMLWLAVDAWRAGPSADATDPPPAKTRLFARGLLANLLNVKAAIFYAVMLPGFIEVSRGRLALQALVLGAAHLFVATTVHVGIVVLAARSGRLLLPAGGARNIGKAYAGALLLVALWLGWSTRRHAM
jgi:threonine/homoserine/homoserine lactone efflux protein